LTYADVYGKKKDKHHPKAAMSFMMQQESSLKIGEDQPEIRKYLGMGGGSKFNRTFKTPMRRFSTMRNSAMNT
jgi:hypothetical protein